MVYGIPKGRTMQRFNRISNFTEIITLADTSTGGGGQIYPKATLVDAFDIYMSKNVEFRGGCVDAPRDAIDDKNVSHYLLDTWFNGDKLMGDIEIIDSDMGKILCDLLDSGVDITLALAAFATFKPSSPESRDLFGDYSNVEKSSKVVDTMVVSTVYATLKSNTTH